MRSIEIISPGQNYSLAVTDDAPTPVPGDHDVLIKVAAAGVNRADIYQAQGTYNPPEGASPILGLEVSGEIITLGKKVRSHSVGDKVCALLSGGGYAEFAAVPEWRVLSLPAGLSPEEAAGLPEAIFTSYLSLMELARLCPGESVLIHGGVSGIGTIAIQLARAFGATVYATAGNAEKTALCEKLGAARGIHYKNQDFVEEIKTLTDGSGVDVVLDMVGGSYLQRNMKAMAKYGRMVSIAFIEGAMAELNLGALLMKNLTWTGMTLRSRSEEQIYDLAQSIRTMVWPLIEQGKIRPLVDRVYPLEQAVEAHKRMCAFGHAGKLVLSVNTTGVA